MGSFLLLSLVSQPLMYICNGGGYGSSFDYIIIILFLVVFKSKKDRGKVGVLRKIMRKNFSYWLGFIRERNLISYSLIYFMQKKQPGIMISLKNRQMCMGWVCIFKGSFFVRKKETRTHVIFETTFCCFT